MMMNSYQYWLGQSLINDTREKVSEFIFKAPFYLVSMSIETMPIFNYGNQKALDLWELNWEEFTQFSSDKSAEINYQEERNQVLEETTNKGYKTGYSAIRISSKGKRYKKENVTIWNVLNQKQEYCGKAAIWYKVTFL